MIPWCFAHDNLNYARYLSAYVSEMSHLEEEHPEALKYLKSGGFSVQIGEGNPFGKIPIDTQTHRRRAAPKDLALKREPLASIISLLNTAVSS